MCPAGSSGTNPALNLRNVLGTLEIIQTLGGECEEKSLTLNVQMLENEMKSREIHFLFQLDGGTMHILILQLLGSFEPS